MSVTRSQLARSPAYVAYGSTPAYFFTRDDIVSHLVAQWVEVKTSMFGRIDFAKTNFMPKFGLRLWGAYENLSVLFPSVFTNPAAGTSLYGASDNPVVIQSTNNDTLTFTNAQITAMPNLHLGVDSDLFAADVEITPLIGNGHNPEDAGAYFTIGTSSYSAATANFAKTNYLRARWTGAWGAFAGFGTIVPQKGFNLSWALGLRDMPIDGLGVVDKTVEDLIVTVGCIPIGPTSAQINAQHQAVGQPMGVLGSNVASTLTMTCAGPHSIAIAGMFLAETGLTYGIEPLRIGQTVWKSTRAFSTGAPQSIVTIS
jgi:hypothetical protein